MLLKTRSSDTMTTKQKWQNALRLLKKQGISVDTLPTLSRRDSSKDMTGLKATIDKFIDLCSTGRRATVQLEDLLGLQREMLEEKLRLLDEKGIISKANDSGKAEPVSTTYVDDRFKELQSDLVVIAERIKELRFAAAETNDTEIMNALQQLEKHEAVKLLIQYLDDFVDMKVQFETKLSNLTYLENEIRTLKISVQKYRDIQQPDDFGDFDDRLQQFEEEEKQYLKHTTSTQNKIKKAPLMLTNSNNL